jgi:hypothetical protein
MTGPKCERDVLLRAAGVRFDCVLEVLLERSVLDRCGTAALWG